MAITPATRIADDSPGWDVLTIVEEDWWASVLDYLHDILPDDAANLHRLQHKCRNYKLVSDSLYKVGVSAPLLHCIAKPKGRALLEEIHG